jgi:hypothetical protein
MEQEGLVDARGLVHELTAFLAREKHLPIEPIREVQLLARRRLLREQARALGVDLGETEASREGTSG